MKDETLCKYHQEFGEGDNRASSGCVRACVVPGRKSWRSGSVNVCEVSWKASPRIPQLLLSVKWSSPLSPVLQEKNKMQTQALLDLSISIRTSNTEIRNVFSMF